MRKTRTVQPSVFQAPEIVHPVAAELERASAWVDQQPELLDMIGTCVPGSTCCGRPGLTCETILRCAVLMHLMGYSYRGLEFALLDSASVQRHSDGFSPLFLWNITCSTPNFLASTRFARDAYPPSNATRCGGSP